jgi:16S rRNA (guanine527-N7)-methyltransferase
MQPARIAELLAPFLVPHQLTAGDLDRISTFIDILLHWNARINLTAIRDPDEIVTRHFGESFFAARHLFPTRNDVRKTSGGRGALQGRVPREKELEALAPVADLGSGAGFPGIPLKLWVPGIHLTLIESNHKKVAFLREVMRSLALTNINVFPARAEQLLSGQGPGQPARFDLITLRAVERFTAALPLAASLLVPSGRLALLIAASQLDSARSTRPAFDWEPPVEVPQSHSRVLLLGARTDRTSMNHKS